MTGDAWMVEAGLKVAVSVAELLLLWWRSWWWRWWRWWGEDRSRSTELDMMLVGEPRLED